MNSSHKNSESVLREQTSVEQRKGEKRLKHYDVYREGYQAGRESLMPLLHYAQHLLQTVLLNRRINDVETEEAFAKWLKKFNEEMKNDI